MDTYPTENQTSTLFVSNFKAFNTHTQKKKKAVLRLSFVKPPPDENIG